MSVLEIYINWVNSVLGEAGGHVDGVEAVQDGKVLCELIDVLAPDAGLQAKVKQSGDCTPMAYINTALEHMKSHGIKIKFPAEDIIHNEIKSMLDILWILILNYGIHFIGQNAFQRSVGIGKKVLLEWCAEELDTTFDPRNTLSFNLCSGNWFLKLLEKVAGCSMEKSQDKSEYIDALLAEIQDRYLIKKDIIKAHDIVDGTVDEHTLMIYLSLLKRRVSDSERHSRREMLSTDGKAAAMAKIHFFEKRARSLSSDSQRSKSADSGQGVPPSRGRSQSNAGRSISANSDVNQMRNRSRSLFDQVTGDGNETSDWSSTGSLVSGREKLSPKIGASSHVGAGGDEILYQTISERVTEHMPDTGSDRDAGKEMENQRISEKETDTLSDYSSGSLTRERPPVKPAMPTVTQHQEQHRASKPESGNGSFTPNGNSRIEASSSQEKSQSDSRQNPNGASHLNEDHLSHRSEENPRNPEPKEENVRIKIKRPKDYIRQWEDTMDRLSGVPMTDEMSSPRAPLISSYKANSRSKSSDINGGNLKTTTSSSSYEHRYTPSLRSKSTGDTMPKSTGDTMPKITISSSDSQSYSSRTLSSTAQHTNGNRLTSSTPQRNGTNDEGLNSVLERLPENMRHQAQEASKFLMHTSGPEVLDLIEAIKSAREGVNSTMPASSQRPQRPQPPASSANGYNEQTILKRRHNPESSSTLSRVRFQPTISTSQSTRRLQSEVVRPIATHISTSPSASPRVNSSSPRRRITPLREGERGSDRMLSISPRSPRSRSLSPRMSAAREIETDSRSPRVHSSTDESFTSASRPLREDLLLKNLGLNTRTVEDERPSSRLRAMGSSPRFSASESPGRMYTSSPRKPLVERLPLNSAYPELTRLDLGLDSDRSYLSHMDDGREDSPPPIRRGGSGRVPRREAWEQQRQQKDPVGGSRADSAAQSKFIDVLCKEIEVLKQKVELMEEEGARRSLSRPSRSPSKEIRDENSQMIFAARSVASTTPDRERAISCPLLQVSSRSKATRSSPRLPSAGAVSSTTVTRSAVTNASSTSSYVPTRGRVASPQRQGGISLGYSSPARSVTPEIWGNNLNSPRALEPETQAKWKQLISQRNLTEAETIELKQALACAIVENDILSAKLNNARHEIHDKLKHTNSVLDDCRRHLAKSNAENMELRTALEQEKEKNAEFESRIKELENNVFEVKTDNQQLENELDQTANLLDRSMTETKGVDALKAENTKLISRLANAENENDSLSEEVRNLKRSNTKAMNTMDELRDCLTKVRRERQELFDEVASLHRRQQSSRVREIISNYQEKGSRDERETERDLSRSFYELTDTDEGIFSGSQTSTEHHYRQNSSRVNRSYDEEELTPVRTTKSSTSDRSLNSPRQVTPRRSSSQHSNYSFDDMSPTSYREIYPHRKSYTPRSRSCSPHQQPRRSSSPGYCSPSLFDESFVDQTLQEIEQDMRRDRRKLLNSSTPVGQRRLRFSSYPSEENLNNSVGGLQHRFNGFDQGTSPSRINRSVYSHRSNSHNQSFQGRENSKSGSAREYSLDRLNKSLSSAEDFRKKRSRSSSPFQQSQRPSILKGHDRLSRDIMSTLRSRSPSAERNRTTSSLHTKPRNLTPDHGPNVSPRYFPRESHSPPTRLSPERERKTSTKRRPLHAKTGAGQIARSLQKEFDCEDKLLKSLSKSSVFQNKSWFEMQSESDGEDTGINSSMSSRSSCERPVSTRKKTPLLTEQQKRYADELIVKYTGNAPI